MSRDFQFIAVVDAIPVLSISDVESSSREILVRVRRDAILVQRVEVNGYGVNTFLILGDTQILVTLAGTPLESVKISEMGVSLVSGTLTGTRSVRLLFSPTLQTREVTGVQKLVQQVVKEFLSSAGSNRFDPEGGGDVLETLGTTLDPSARARVSASLARSAQGVQERFLAKQASSANLASTEKLLSFSLVGLRFLTTHVEADLRLTTRAGNNLEFPIEL